MTVPGTIIMSLAALEPREGKGNATTRQWCQNFSCDDLDLNGHLSSQFATMVAPKGSSYAIAEPHTHRAIFEQFEIRSGSGEFFIDGEWRSITAGALIIVPPGVLHGIRTHLHLVMRIDCWHASTPKQDMQPWLPVT